MLDKIMSTSDASVTLTDYDSSSSLEIVVDTRKLREELAREEEEEKRTASDEKENNKNGKGKKKTLVKNGRVGDVKGPMSRIQRIEREIQKRRMMKAQVMQNMHKHLQLPFVREAYDYFKRDIPAENDLNSDKTRKKVRVAANENFLSVTIFRHSPPPY